MTCLICSVSVIICIFKLVEFTWKPLMWWWLSSFSNLSLPKTSSIFSRFLMAYSLISFSRLSKFHHCQSECVLIRSVLMGPDFSSLFRIIISAVSNFLSAFSELTLMFRSRQNWWICFKLVAEWITGKLTICWPWACTNFDVFPYF